MTGATFVPLKPTGVELIDRERTRQLKVEGYTPHHDQAHTGGELAIAAACYALPDPIRYVGGAAFIGPRYWPWSARFWKPTPHNRIHELAKAGALIAAEIDRLQAAQP